MVHTVQDVMTKQVFVVREDAPFKKIVRLMHDHRVSALPVVSVEGRLVGIVSEADLLLKEELVSPADRAPRTFERKRRRLERSKADGRCAAEVMTSPVISVAPDASLGQAARMVHEGAVKRLPVVDADGRIVGILSRSDLIRVFLRPDEEILRDVIDQCIRPSIWIEPDRVRVVVEQGVVFLEGELEHRSHIPVLVERVHQVTGVVTVENRLSHEIDDVSVPREFITPWGFVTPRLPV